MEYIKQKETNDSFDYYYKLDSKIANYGDFKVSIYYSLGGMNYYTGNPKPRGYYLSAQPVNLITFPDGTQTMEATLMGDFMATSIFIEEAKRLNKNRLRQLAGIYSQTDNDQVQKLVTYFIGKDKK